MLKSTNYLALSMLAVGMIAAPIAGCYLSDEAKVNRFRDRAEEIDFYAQNGLSSTPKGIAGLALAVRCERDLRHDITEFLKNKRLDPCICKEVEDIKVYLDNNGVFPDAPAVSKEGAESPRAGVTIYAAQSNK